MRSEERKGLFLFLCTIILSLLLSTLAVTTSLAADDDTIGGDMPTCKTDECHSEYGEKEYVHGPIGIGACAICHKSTTDKHPNDKKVDFELAAVGKELCYLCHE